MPVKIKCSGCEKVLAVPDAARGKAVKCPACQTRIAVPAAPAAAKSAGSQPAGSKPAAKKPVAKKKPADSEDALASLDMRKIEDSEARVCIKCGYDMKWQDEEDNECPECGFDSFIGGQGAKAKKKAMKGPDPADFYLDMVSNGWKFVNKNNFIAVRSVIYTLVSLLIAFGCAYMYLNLLYMWPPRLFLMLCFTISIFVIPGWMWFLDVEVLKLVAERKDKFKRLNFDFFQSSALGITFAVWCCVFALPIMLIPAAMGYTFIKSVEGKPEIVLPICFAVGLLPIISMLPVVMAHLAMPVPYPGWLVWRIVPIWARNLKPISYWFIWFLITNIPNIAGIGTIGALYGPTIVKIVSASEKNAQINRTLFYAKENPNAKKLGAKEKEAVKVDDLQEIDFMPMIVPCVILIAMAAINGFTGLFNMRTHAQFVYFFKSNMELIDKRKEFKYVSKNKEDEELEELKPKTMLQMIGDGVAFFLIGSLICGICGMLYGNLSDFGTVGGVVCGVGVGIIGAWLVVWGQSVKEAFQHSAKWGAITALGLFPIGYVFFLFQNIQERMVQLIRIIAGLTITLVVSIVLSILVLGEFVEFGPPKPKVPQPAVNVNEELPVGGEKPAGDEKPADGAANPEPADKS